MKDWQRMFLRAAGAAAGVTVVLAVAALSFYWYSSKPKAWNTKEISSVSTNARTFYQFEADGGATIAGFSLKFVLANNTDRDYTLPLDVKLFERQVGTDALEEFRGKLEHAVLIPARDRAQMAISLDYSCKQFDADGKYQSERDEVTCFNDALGNVSGFVVLDEGSKVKLTLQKPALAAHVPSSEKAPPCKSGAATCEPWERNWEKGSKLKPGAVVTKDGEIISK